MDSPLHAAVFPLVLAFVFATAVPVSSDYLRNIESCPEAGYYFRREVMAHATAPGPCYLCVCQGNNTAACSLQHNTSCDLNTQPQLGRRPRLRRSPVSLSDIFFRDATRDFFDKQLPQQCKPHESSFSDGCPPADWCIGCTVCDCDANGRWDCHILSFCNGEEKKKMVKRPRVPLPVMPTRRVYHKGQPKPKPKNITLRPKKIVKKSVQSTPTHVSRKTIKKQHNGKLQPNKRINTTRKPQQKKLYKKLHKIRTTTISPKKKYLRKRSNKPTTYKPMTNIETEVTKIMTATSQNEQTELGQKIVQRVMSTVQKMIQKEISKMSNATRVQRSVVGKDCSKTKKKYKKTRYHNTKQGKIRKHNKQINRNLITRRKREALDFNLSITDLIDADDLQNKSSNVSQMPKTAVEEISTTDIQVILNTTVDFGEYKYSINSNSNNASSINAFIPMGNETTNHNLVVNLTNTESTDSTTGKYEVKTEDDTLLITDPNLNGLYPEKWYSKKNLANNIKIIEVSRSDIIDNEIRINGNILKSKMDTQDIDMKPGIANKHNLKQILVKNHKSFSAKYFTNNTVNDSHDNGKISNLQSLLHNLSKDNNSTSPSNIKQTFNLFKYLRSVFKKIFNRNRNQNFKQNHISRELQTLYILCEDIDNEDMNKYHRVVLRSKLHDLNAETDKIFKILKVIKGLLIVIEIPYNQIENHEKELANDDFKKLNAIMKGTYTANNFSLTETQSAQISYLQENVHIFIQSISRFASILKEIFDVLYKSNRKYTCQRKLRPSKEISKQKTFNKIKNLLVNYNIVQNTFMKNMYKLLTDTENKTTEESKPKVSNIKMNHTKIIDKYSKNIVENLRRLKDLAQVLNSNRIKRQTGENHAIEYLLLLMEYLLKQNQPSDHPPVNDGIDLLVEAIQNAPDIKSIRKKFQEYPSNTQTASSDTNVDLENLTKDNISDSHSISKQEFKLPTNEKDLPIMQEDNKEDDSTQIVYYKKFDDYDNNTVIYNEYDTTENANRKNRGKEEKTGFEKFENDIDGTKLYEVFSSDVGDEKSVIISTTERGQPTTETVNKESNTFIALQNYRLDDEINNNKKHSLDWIEENFSREIREFAAENTSISSIATIFNTLTLASTKPTIEGMDNISSITVELEDENNKKNKVKADAVLYKKNQHFLKYLDYGTERSDTDESRSKEKFSEDRFPTYFVR